MHKDLQAATEALDALAKSVLALWDTRLLREGWNAWNVAALTRDDLAAIPNDLAENLRSANLDDVPQAMLPSIQSIPRKLNYLTQDTVPHMFNGNAPGAVPVYTSTLAGIAAVLEPLTDWRRFPDHKMMPAALARTLRAMQARLSAMAPEMDRVQDQVSRIQQASEAADQLPTDLEELKNARKTIAALSTQSAELRGKIDELHKAAEKAKKEASEFRDEAEKLVKQCGEAYRITTSTGLAAAFDHRARSLTRSVWAWVILLIGALGAAVYLGALRVQLLSSELALQQPRTNAIVLHSLLAVFSVAAPVWLAWLATKQIGQRFRLSEDYAYKSSVAKAYEGYRREAARIDKDLETRLLGSAITRLEEAPLRLVELESHGTPWHEMLNSPAFAKIIDAVPDLPERLRAVINDTLEKAKSVVPKPGEKK